MNEITFIVVRIVVSILSAFIGYAIKRYLVPILKEWKEQLIKADLYDEIEKAVKAAQQTLKGEGLGSAKKQKVLNYISNWLKKKGLEITDEQLDQLIEAAVFNMKNEGVLYTVETTME